jgi:hypothetical protein
MDEWMEYIYHQRTMPKDATGVQVILDTIDPNGNTYEVGRTTSDSSGNYGVMFTPQVPGTYQITARFDGSASYGSSKATTYLGVKESSETTPQPTVLGQTSMADLYLLPGIGIIVAAIAIVGALILLALRKHA